VKDKDLKPVKLCPRCKSRPTVINQSYCAQCKRNSEVAKHVPERINEKRQIDEMWHRIRIEQEVRLKNARANRDGDLRG
jgi:predicted amidophosphoribosyltransferase